MQTQTIKDEQLQFLVAANAAKRRSSKMERDPHFLKAFFRSRGISQRELSILTGVRQPHISDALNYKALMSASLEDRLLRIRAKIMELEDKTGTTFGQ